MKYLCEFYYTPHRKTYYCVSDFFLRGSGCAVSANTLLYTIKHPVDHPLTVILPIELM